jgi:hypothetical protein
LISFALLAVISLSADVILFTRSGDVRFLMGQACFNAPMAVAYWLSGSPSCGFGKPKAADRARQMVHAAFKFRRLLVMGCDLDGRGDGLGLFWLCAECTRQNS